MSDSILFVENIPKLFMCPNNNCLKNMIDPVTAKCGHSFCKKCSLQIDKCPIDNYKMDKKNYFPNLVLSTQIQEMLVYCNNGIKYNEMTKQLDKDENGCPETFPLKNKDIHELQCMFRVVQCPYTKNKCRESIRLKDLQDHKHCNNDNNRFIYADQNAFHGQLQKTGIYNPRNEPDMQQIADNLTLRIKRLETQMSGSLNRMENMFFQIQSNTNRIIHHLKLDPTDNGELKIDTAKSSLSVFTMSEGNYYKNSLTTKEMANLTSVESSNGGLPNNFNSSHWICPFSFLNAGILKGHRKTITSIIQFENFIITSSQDQTIRLWNISSFIKGEFGKLLTNGGCVAILSGHDYPISCMVMSRHSREIVSIDVESNLKIWDFNSSSLTREKKRLHDQVTTSVAVSKSVIFTGSKSEIKIWNFITLQQIDCVVNDINHFVKCLVINEPQEEYLYSSGHNQVLVWKIQLKNEDETSINDGTTLTLMRSIPHSFYSVNSLVISSRYLIIGTYNKNIQIFNINSGEHLFSLAGHVAQVNGLCLTSSESHLVSVSTDGCINIWELDRRTLIQSINIGSNYCGQAVTILGDILFVCGSDAEIKIYRYDRMFS